MSMKKLQEDTNCPKPDPHGAARTDSAAKQHPALHSVFGTEQKVFQTVKKTTPQTNKQTSKTKATLHLHQGRLWFVFGLSIAQEKDLY